MKSSDWHCPRCIDPQGLLLRVPPEEEIIVAGDWNAAWDSADRSLNQISSTDQHHRKALDELRKWGCALLENSNFSDRSKSFGCMLEARASRNDDKVDSMLNKALPEEVVAIGKRSHHLPLIVSLHL